MQHFSFLSFAFNDKQYFYYFYIFPIIDVL